MNDLLRESCCAWAQYFHNALLGVLVDVVHFPPVGHGSGFPAAFGKGEAVTAEVAVSGGFFKHLEQLFFSHGMIIDEAGDPHGLQGKPRDIR